MASDNKPSWRRFAAWLLGSVLALIFLGLLSVFWLVGSESGARASFELLRQWSGNAIVAQSVHGRLIGPLSIGELRLEKDGNKVQASQLTLHWQPQGLRDGLLHISLLHADQLNLTLAAQDEATPPDFPRLPFRLQLDQLEVDALTLGKSQDINSWQSEPLRLSASASLENARLKISAARIERGSGRAAIAGEVVLDGAKDFSVRGDFQRLRLHDFGQFPDWPAMTLNGNFDAQGKQQPQVQGQMQFTLTDSQINRRSLSASGKVLIDTEAVNIPRLHIVAGANQLTLQGRLQTKSATMQGLRFALKAPRLSELGAGFKGALHINGTASGSLHAPLLNIQGEATRLRLPGNIMISSAKGDASLALRPREAFMVRQITANIRATNLVRQAARVGALQLHVQASQKSDAPLRIEAKAKNIAFAGQQINTLELTMNGSAQQHEISAKVDGRVQTRSPDTPGQNPVTLRFTAEGGLSDLATSPQWQGLLTSASLRSKYAAQLKGNAAILLSAQRSRIGAMTLSTTMGQLQIDELRRDGAQRSGRGSFSNLQMANLLKFLDAHPLASTDVVLAGDWDFQLADGLTGQLTLRRTAGDVRLRGETPLALGLQKFDATVQVREGRIAVALAAEGSQLGIVSLSATSTIRADNGAFLPDAQSPFKAELTMALPSIAWVGPMLSPALLTAGSLHGKVSLSGTLSDPRFSGQIAGQKLRVYFVDTGIDLQQGVLESDFTDDTLHIRQLRFSSGDGEIAATGPVTVRQGKIGADLQVRATRFTVLDRIDRKLTLSGKARLALAEGHARLDGKLNIDAGLIDVGRAGEPQLSDDVVVIGRDTQQSKALPTEIDIVISFNENLLLRGQGLNGRVGGDLRITSAAGTSLQARGLLKVVRGTYTAYGRELIIERGNLRFDGAPGNPALDIRAMRRGLEVEAGVAIGGSALAPRIMLVSEPQVPDAEKLSWLVLGQGLTTAGNTELGALQSAATQLLSQSAAASMQSQLASAFGVDTITLSQSRDNLQQRIITVGKRVSSRLVINYQQGLQSAGNALVLRYTLSPRLSVEAETGARSVFSLFYNFAFD